MSIASPPPPTPQRIAIIGGGLAGLAAAHRLSELARERGTNIAVTLFECGPRLGGVIGTERVGGYLIDAGADSFLTNKPAAVNLCRRLGIEDRLISTSEQHRGALVLLDGRTQPVPEGFQLMSPTAIWPMLVSPILSPWGKLRMALEYFVPRKVASGGRKPAGSASVAGKEPAGLRPPLALLQESSLPDESLASFVRRRFGREALERLVQPLVGGIYTSDPEKLSLAATMPRFLEMERDRGSLLAATLFSTEKTVSRPPTSDSPSSGSVPPQAGSATDTKSSGARYGLFAGLAGGMEDLLSALRSRVEAACEVRLNAPVARINRKQASGDGYRIELADGVSYSFDAVLLTASAHRAASLLGELDPELAVALNEIEYASSAIVVTGHRLADIAHPLNAFGLVIPQRERRKILAVSFSSRKFPDRAPCGSVLLRTFVGGALQPDLLSLSDEELVSLVRSELAEMLGVRGQPDFARVYRYPRAMPQYHVGHLDRVARIEALTARHPGFALAGNAYRGVGIPDVIASGEAAAESILA